MIRALFGGSFDPFHEGHLAIVEVLRERDLCDIVHVVPAWRSPFKRGTSVSGDHRLAMTRLALDGREDVEIEEIEVKRRGPSYTIETLRTLHERHGEDTWRLVVGSDSYTEFSRWRESTAILDLARLLILPRRGSGAIEVGPEAELIDGFDVPVSSTDVRRHLLSGSLGDVRVPGAVADYIRDHELYGLAGSSDSGGTSCP